MHHSSIIKKAAIIFVLVCFLLATGLTSILYLGSSQQADTGSLEAIPATASSTDATSTDSIAPGSILNAFSTGSN